MKYVLSDKYKPKKLYIAVVLVAFILVAINICKLKAEGDNAVYALNIQARQKLSSIQMQQNLVNDDVPWNLILVNRDNPVDLNYSPSLKSIGNHKFDARAVDKLEEMLESARNEGLNPIICSSYRTVDKQKKLYLKQVEKQINLGYSEDVAKEKAKEVVAYPGTSEHHIGLAVDIVANDYQMLDENQANTPEAIWLKENACRFGFILRYPDGKQDITNIIFEPWHYRYVGEEAAKYITENNICMEEYMQEKFPNKYNND